MLKTTCGGWAPGGMMMRKNEGYDVRLAGKNVELFLYGPIGEGMGGDGISAQRVADDLQKARGVKLIRVHINSPGGSAFDAVAIHSALAAHAARVEVVIDGAALSAASIVAMAGEKISMAASAMMMLHEPYVITGGDADELRQSADMLDKLRGNIVNIYAVRSGQAAERISEMMEAETWLTADEAVELGLADGVVEGRRVAACADPAKFENAPAWARERMMDSRTEITNMAGIATIAELREALPRAQGDELLAYLEAELTIAQARVMDERAAQRRRPGVEPLADRGRGDPVLDGDAVQMWEARISQLMSGAGMTRGGAISTIVHENPELHRAYLEAYNARRQTGARG